LLSILSLGIVAAVTATLVGGCASAPAPDPSLTVNYDSIPGLRESAYVPSVLATCTAPCGWLPQPLKENNQHTHEIWLSPSGATAYGVIHFKLPWPVGPDIALTGFMAGMRRSEGDAHLLEAHADRRGIRFVADSGEHHLRGQLIVQGWEGWAFYAATDRSKPVDADELKLAELSLQHTQAGDAEPPIRQARAGED
jgi:hypothetical protein